MAAWSNSWRRRPGRGLREAAESRRATPGMSQPLERHLTPDPDRHRYRTGERRGTGVDRRRPPAPPARCSARPPPPESAAANRRRQRLAQRTSTRRRSARRRRSSSPVIVPATSSVMIASASRSARTQSIAPRSSARITKRFVASGPAPREPPGGAVVLPSTASRSARVERRWSTACSSLAAARRAFCASATPESGTGPERLTLSGRSTAGGTDPRRLLVGPSVTSRCRAGAARDQPARRHRMSRALTVGRSPRSTSDPSNGQPGW